MGLFARENGSNARTTNRFEMDARTAVEFGTCDGGQSGGRSSIMRGYSFMVMSAVFQAGMTFFVHVAETHYGYPPNSSLVVPAVTAATLSLIYVIVNRLFHTFRLSRDSTWRLCIVGILGSTTFVFIIQALARLPVGTAVTVFYAYPAITSLLSDLLLKERFTLSQGVILLLNFTGIALVSQPSTTGSDAGRNFLLGILFALCAALSVSGVCLFIRAMGHSVHFILGTAAMAIGIDMYALILCDATTMIAVNVNLIGTVYALMSRILGFGSQLTLSRALQDAPAGPDVVVRSLNVPLSLMLGLVFLNETASFAGICGILLTLFSIFAIGIRQ